MKKLKYSLGIFILLAFLFSGCQEDDVSVGEIVAPSNIQVTVDIVGADPNNPNGDGSGTVNFSATADNAITYTYVFNGTAESSPSGNRSYNFSVTGVSTYVVTVIAVGTGGVSSSTTVEVDVLVLYEPPIELITMLTSGPWRIKSEAPGHFGLGPVGGTEPSGFFAAPPNDKATVGMYDDRYLFNADGTFTHITNSENDDPTEDPSGTVFGRVNLIDELGPHSIDPNGADIENYPLNDYSTSWSVSAPGGIESLNLTGIGFIGYYTGGNHSYELFRFAEQPANELILRTTDGNNEFDWWLIITSEEPGGTDDIAEPPFDTLVWSDEFDTVGAPSTANWTYDLGTGDNGWGNNESQSYTDDPSNVIVEDGVLKITARAENGGYTSARIKTQDLFSFTYGKVDVRAKLPTGGGTWPAIWMLGSNITEVGWPNCGEIDIMEHVGNNQDVVSSALHFPGNNGGNAIFEETNVAGASTDFHVYSVEWSSTEIVFSIDDTPYHTFPYSNNLPFYNNDFFLILNVAMGGTFGGAIDPAFTESTMEIDYVRVYQ
ncbi:glycoside hydrolase family 16 protein [uncultured Aquimarina sp.]|uniref:glycoside hydrolase family 16 protein n=1 Tax=uncultured Aquimarina sp. TaxID=575652 RepID=UPI00260D25F0|nr:glycoside hydrolase family 16 protein [uncultured Aquimarina sp.]